MARSATKRASAALGCRAGASRRRGRAAGRAAGTPRSSRCDTEIASSEIVRLVRVVGERRAHQLLGDLGERSRSPRSAASSVIERVTERRSAKRTRTVTVRPGRDFARSRVATRSARCSSVGRIHALVGRLPAERRLRAGRMRAAVRDDRARVAVPGERGELLARRLAEQPLQRPIPARSRELADGASRRSAASRASVTGPTPHISSTGRSWRKASSVAGSTTTSPSGLATCEAILARCLVRATPIEIGRPSSSRTRRRIVLRDFGRRHRTDACSRRRRRRPRRSRCARPAA